MELGLQQVADIFGVTENRIIQWINNENLPSDLVADQYRFNRADLLEWAANQRKSFSPSIYAMVNGDLTAAGTHLTDALKVGGVLENVAGGDLRAILGTALQGLPIPESIGQETLIDLFVSREGLGSSAIGNGIAIPHPRQPLLLTVPGSIMRLCYLSQPLDIETPDDTPVDKLILLVCPTDHEHLQMLARLGALLQSDAVREALRNRLNGENLFRILRKGGRQLHEEHSDSGATT